jgi:hypothetical protein
MAGVSATPTVQGNNNASQLSGSNKAKNNVSELQDLLSLDITVKERPASWAESHIGGKICKAIIVSANDGIKYIEVGSDIYNGKGQKVASIVDNVILNIKGNRIGTYEESWAPAGSMGNFIITANNKDSFSCSGYEAKYVQVVIGCLSGGIACILPTQK